MEKFLVLYMTPLASLNNVTKNTDSTQGGRGKEEWENWMKKHTDNIIDAGGPIGKTKRVTSDGVGDVINEVMGYSIVRAESHEAAVNMLKDVPNSPGGSLDVMLIMSMD